MIRYWTDDFGSYGSGPVKAPLPTGYTELDEADYTSGVAAQVAAAEAEMQAYVESARSAAADTARAVYDEVVGIHPITALAVALIIDPTFTP